jgi:hypothetical protein
MDKFLKTRDKIAYYLPWGAEFEAHEIDENTYDLLDIRYVLEGHHVWTGSFYHTNEEPKPLAELLSQVIDKGRIDIEVSKETRRAFTEYYYIIKPNEVIQVSHDEYFDKYIGDKSGEPRGNKNRSIEIDTSTHYYKLESVSK